MKTKNLFLPLVIWIAVFLPTFSVSQNLVWAKAMGGTDVDWGSSICTDASGNVYTTGQFKSIVDFDPGPGTYTLDAGSSGSDIFISKLDINGNFVWAKRIGSNFNDDVGNAIKVDASGNIYTTGFFIGSVDFDPGPGVFTLNSAGPSSNVFILKLDAAGNFVWAKVIGGESAASITLDGSGNVYTTGYFTGGDFDPGPGTYTLYAGSSGYDIFISKLDAAGNFVWAKSMGGPGWDFGLSIAIDVSGNVITTGAFELTSDFDPGIGTYNLTSSGNYDIFISKLDAAGNFVWAKRIGDSQSDGASSTTIDASGNIFTTGRFNGVPDFDPGIGTYTLISAGDDIFVSKLDGAGNFIWARSIGSTGFDLGSSLVTDVSGNVYTTGLYSGTVDFDPGVGVYNQTVAGAQDIFISKLDPAGNFVWANSMGGIGIDNGLSIITDIAGNILTTGHFQLTCDFDPSTAIYNLTSNGNDDIFIHKMNNIVGINELINSTHLQIFPNPVSQTLNISSEQNFERGTEIEITNTLGQTVLKTEFKSRLDVSQLARGYYVLKITTHDNHQVHSKFIKE